MSQQVSLSAAASAFTMALFALAVSVSGFNETSGSRAEQPLALSASALTE